MNGNFELAIQLLIVGMLTVFAVLFIVIFIGNTIIRFVNKYMPETVATITKKSLQQSTNSIDPKKMSAIVSAIQVVTQEKGKVVKVEKI